MRAVAVVSAVVLVALFAVGVFDFLAQIVSLFRAGRLVRTATVVSLIDQVLLSLVIVAVFQTVVAYVRDHRVVRTVIAAGLVAVTPKLITIQTTAYGSAADAALAAYAAVLLVLIAAIYVVQRTNATLLDDRAV